MEEIGFITESEGTLWKKIASLVTFGVPMDYSPPDSSVHGIFQARILEWAAVPFSRESFQTQGSNLGLRCCRRSPALQVRYLLTQSPGDFTEEQWEESVMDYRWSWRSDLKAWLHVIDNWYKHTLLSYALLYRFHRYWIFLQIEGLWQSWVEPIYQHYFFNSFCSPHVCVIFW